MNRALDIERQFQTAPAQIEEDEIDLRQYWNIINRNKWGILGLSTVVCLLTLVVVSVLTPVYRATATLLIESEDANVVSIAEIYGIDSTRQEYFQTQFEILSSRQLAEMVISKNAIHKHPEYDPDLQRSFFNWRRWIPLLPPPKPASKERKLQSVIASFQNNLFIEPIRNTQLVNISFESTDSELTYLVANAIGNAYIESHLEARFGLTQKAADWLTGRLSGMRIKLERSEHALQQFREKENLVDVQGVLTLTANEIGEITSRLVSARNRAAEAKSQLDEVGQIDSGYNDRWEILPGVLQDGLVRTLKQKQVDANRILSELTGRYGPKHPKLIAAISQSESSQKGYRARVRKIVAGFEKTYIQAFADQNVLEGELERTKQEIQEISRKNYQLSELTRNLSTNRQLYDLFFRRFKETSETDFDAANARFIDFAVKPYSPVKPRKRLVLAIAGALSVIAGVMLAFLRAALDNTIRVAGEVEEKLGQPVVGVLPVVKDVLKANTKALLIFADHKHHAFTEAVRTIRTSVILSGVDRPTKTIVITSSVPAEGKTTLAVNLAMALGQMEKVVLVEADLRRPTLARDCELPPDSLGITHVLADTEELKSCIHKLAEQNIDVVPAGIVPPNPLELLSSKRFAKLIESLQEQYDRVIIDSAPTQAVSDSLVLSTLATAMIYVVKADSTTTHVATNGIQRLLRVNAPLIGVVLNQFDSESAAKYGYYSKGYYDYYGYGYSSREYS